MWRVSDLEGYAGCELRRVFGENPAGGPDDLFTLVERRARHPGAPPALRIDCGTEDHLLEANRVFRAYLEQLGIDHEYAEFPGRHDWTYWDRHVQEAIVFFAARLKAG